MYWLSLCFVLALCSANAVSVRRMFGRQASSGRSNLDNTTFPTLNNHHIRGVSVTEQEYLWVARVIHSRTGDFPHVCTASCIEERIFVTAARCIFLLKVEFTTVRYQDQILHVRAFVVPSKPTKQMFDDIGFIVIEEETKVSRWATIKTYTGANRTDDEFMWLEGLGWNEDPQQHYVVGYAADDNITKQHQTWDTNYTLREIKIVIDLALCNELTSMDHNGHPTDFWVPCYHSCNTSSYQDDEECKPYHGVEGGAVFDKKNKTLIGIATWGAYDQDDDINLPVGFSVLNSNNFYVDRECALKIRDSAKLPTTGGYQSLCDR